jgi:hypothetical protein
MLKGETQGFKPFGLGATMAGKGFEFAGRL